jgi:hypothetical protein
VSSFTGGCVCGAVRYELTAEHIVMFDCHCRDCQHVSGGAYAPVVYVPAGSFKITKGELRRFSTDSPRFGQNVRGFCANCGSRISGAETRKGVGIVAGSLDQPSLFRPQFHIHVTDAQPWDILDPDIPAHDQYPPM